MGGIPGLPGAHYHAARIGAALVWHDRAGVRGVCTVLVHRLEEEQVVDTTVIVPVKIQDEIGCLATASRLARERAVGERHQAGERPARIGTIAQLRARVTVAANRELQAPGSKWRDGRARHEVHTGRAVGLGRPAIQTRRRDHHGGGSQRVRAD